MNFPESVLNVAKLAAQKHADDVSAAVDEAERQIRRLPEFGDLVAALVRQAVQTLVYNERHRSNVRMRAEAGEYGRPAKVNVGASAAVNAVIESLYLYRIAGTTLGLVRGADLAGIAASENAQANGHIFNARLCSELSALVPAEKAVQDAVSERKLRSIFDKIRRQGEAA